MFFLDAAEIIMKVTRISNSFKAHKKTTIIQKVLFALHNIITTSCARRKLQFKTTHGIYIQYMTTIDDIVFFFCYFKTDNAISKQ